MTYTVKQSAINGLGLFTDQAIAAGQILFVVLEVINGQLFQHPIGTPMNHSYQANTIAVSKGNYILLQSTKFILPGQEITINYAQAMQLLNKLKIPHPNFLFFEGQEKLVTQQNEIDRPFKLGTRFVAQ